MLEFLRPWAFLLVPLPLLVWWILPYRQSVPVLQLPKSIKELLTILHHEDRRYGGLTIHHLLASLGWCALVAALAGPQTLGATLLRPSGRDLVVAVDLSRSMAERDVDLEGEPVTRFAVVQEMVKAFIHGRKGDRISLIAFAEEAYLIAPLTFDSKAVAGFLDTLVIGLPGRRTALGQAIGLAIKVLEPAPETARILVLLSDGESNAGDLTAEEAAGLAAERKIRIHTIGFGGDIREQGASSLERVASIAGGRFFTAGSKDTLGKVYEAIDKLEPVVADPDEIRLRKDWSGIALIVALAALGGLTWTDGQYR